MTMCVKYPSSISAFIIDSVRNIGKNILTEISKHYLRHFFYSCKYDPNNISNCLLEKDFNYYMHTKKYET